MGQLVGLEVYHRASTISTRSAIAPHPGCTIDVRSGTRWIGELSLERTRAGQTAARWTETRTLDVSETGASLRLAASYLTEIGGTGSQSAEWRVVPSGTYLATPASESDLWIRRDTTPGERARLFGLGPGTLQSLIDAVDGWKRTEEGWRQGDEPLRCSDDAGRQGFADRFVASTQPMNAALVATADGRKLEAEWRLSDGSTLRARFEDRVVPFGEEIDAPDEIVATARDGSMARAQQLLEKLAADGLAEVASAPSPAESL